MDAERKLRITYEATPIVWIEVRGEAPSKAEQAMAPLPVARRDGGLVGRLLGFMNAHDIYRAVRPGHAGAGEYSGGFYAFHAKQIISFLKKEGCTKTKQK